MENILGNSGKPRLFAMIVDNLIASIIVLVAAVKTPGLDAMSRALVCGTLYLGYFFVAEGMWGRTLGKVTTGLVVRRLDGSVAGWKESAVRTVLRLLEVNPILFGAIPGGLVVAFSARKQRLGDMLAGTVVTGQCFFLASEVYAARRESGSL